MSTTKTKNIIKGDNMKEKFIKYSKIIVKIAIVLGVVFVISTSIYALRTLNIDINDYVGSEFMSTDLDTVMYVESADKLEITHKGITTKYTIQALEGNTMLITSIADTSIKHALQFVEHDLIYSDNGWAYLYQMTQGGSDEM